MQKGQEYAKRKLKEAQKEASQRYERLMEAAKKEVRSLREEELARIESEAARKRQALLADLKAELLEEVRKDLEERFEEIAVCFLRWLEERFEEGDLTLYEKLETGGLGKFRLQRTPRKEIRFSQKNVVVVFTPDSIMEEFSAMIEEEISKRIGG
ncbi:hypothetical protein [Hydrogenimonas sp.]